MHPYARRVANSSSMCGRSCPRNPSGPQPTSPFLWLDSTLNFIISFIVNWHMEVNASLRSGSCSSKLIKLEEGAWEPLTCSQLVRSTTNNRDRCLASEVGGALWDEALHLWDLMLISRQMLLELGYVCKAVGVHWEL